MFANSPKPKHSLWGYIQDAIEIMPGVWQISTAGHGGFIISHERKQAMPEVLRGVATHSGAVYQYEEDCDWTLVALSFPEEFAAATSPYLLTEARRIAMICWPAVVAAIEMERGIA